MNDRVAGADRFGTAAAACTEAYEDGTDTVIIATARNFPDALAASGLAGANDACILLVEVDSVPEATVAAINDLGATNAIIVGGTAAVSDAVVTFLEDEVGITTSRVAGADRFETAAAIANAIGADNIGEAEGDGPTAILASGRSSADALAAGSMAAAGDGTGQFPILLTEQNDLPQATIDAIEDLGITNIIVVGGTGVISEAVRDEAGEVAGDDDVTVLAGTDRNKTAVAIGEFEVTELGWAPTTVCLANSRKVAGAEGADFGPDALTGGPLCGLRQAPLLLVVTADDLGADTEGFLDDHSDTITELLILGGTAVISDIAESAAVEAAENTENDEATGNETVTTRPELVSAAIGATVTATQVTPTSPAGTRVTFTFDEAVSTLPGFTPVAANFHVYSGSGTQYNGSGTPTISTDGLTVTVNFADLNTAALAGSLTLATVDFGAVRDAGGAENPEGDAPIGTTVTTTPAAAAGVTTAPDLVSVGNFRQGATANTTAVDFTFDQAANVATTTGFHLVTTDGQDTACTSSSTAGVPSGGTVPGGTGTTTITVVCTNYTPAGGAQTAFSTSNVARGYIEAGSVSTGTGGTGVTNPIEAADVAGASSEPDLVSVTFTAGGTGVQDTAVFTFDQAIIQATPTLFAAYNNNAGTIAPDGTSSGTCVTSTSSSSTTTCVINPANPTQVLVRFANGALASAVGANVTDLAVTGTLGATLVSNEPDEEAAAPTTGGTATTQEPGFTTRPELTAVTLVQGTDPFGNTGSFRARYTFDRSLTGVTSNSKFFLYLADGTRLVATSCTLGATATSTPSTSQVDCTAYTGTTVATSAQIGAAVLGTVDDGAVASATGANPEGGEVTTGGTGTPAA